MAYLLQELGAAACQRSVRSSLGLHVGGAQQQQGVQSVGQTSCQRLHKTSDEHSYDSASHRLLG